jgi:hypothetical protein
MNCRSLIKKQISALASAFLLISFSSNVLAGVIPADLAVTGSVEVNLEDDIYGLTGAYGLTSQGITSSSDFTDDEFDVEAFDESVFDRSGDGFSFSAENIISDSNDYNTSFLGGLFLENLSDTLTYDITFLFQADYSLFSSDANGQYASASTWFELYNLDSNEVEFEFYKESNLVADADAGSETGLVAGTESVELTFTLSPMEQLNLGLFWDVYGYAEIGLPVADVSSSLTIAVEEVPEPAAWAIMLLGLSGIAWRKKSQK